MRFKSFTGFALLTTIVLFLSAAHSHDEGPTTVTLLAPGHPRAQFAGYYVAREKGFYAKRGLDVVLLRGDAHQDPAELLRKGQADLCTLTLLDGIRKSNGDARLVNIGQIVQRSSLMLIAMKSSGIDSPADMQGMKVGFSRVQDLAPLGGFLNKNKLTVQFIPQVPGINLFVRGGIDLIAGMLYDEYHAIINAGLDPEELRTFSLADEGMDFPEDGIYCLEKAFRSRTEQYRNFVKASLQGWKYALDYPDETLDIVMRYVMEMDLATNRAHQKWMLDRLRDVILVRGGDSPLGMLRREDYDRAVEAMKLRPAVDAPLHYSSFFIDCIGR